MWFCTCKGTSPFETPPIRQRKYFNKNKNNYISIRDTLKNQRMNKAEFIAFLVLAYKYSVDEAIGMLGKTVRELDFYLKDNGFDMVSITDLKSFYPTYFVRALEDDTNVVLVSGDDDIPCVIIPM